MTDPFFINILMYHYFLLSFLRRLPIIVPKAKNLSRWIIMVQLWGEKTIVKDFPNFFCSFRLLFQSTEKMNKILLWYLSVHSNNSSESFLVIIIFFYFLWTYSYYLTVSNLRIKFVSTWKLIMLIYVISR